MKYIKPYSNYELVREFSEFNLQRFNSDNTDVSIGLSPDNSLSVNAFDRQQDDIRSGISRLNTIMRSLSNTAAYRSLKGSLSLEDQYPTSLNILRIIPANADYDVYLTFKINEQNYTGVIRKILSSKPQFTSPDVFNDNSLTQATEWQIRLRGLIINTFKKFLNVESGIYKALKDKIYAYNTKTGKELEIRKDDQIEVIQTIPDENRIIIRYNNDTYNLRGDSFIYFNYWFN
jgi:hypothetical protein